MSKYGKYILTELKMPSFTPEAEAAYNKFGRRILWMDKNNVPGAFQMNCSWYLKKLEKGPREHVHDVDEILGFFGNDPQDPYNLHGEVELWLGDEKQTITQSTMVFIPAGIKHCPLNLIRVDRPIFHFSVVTSGEYVPQDVKDTKTSATDLSRYVVTELKTPNFPPEFVTKYNEFATRILWMDKNVVPGAFQMNCSWYREPNYEHLGYAHKHDVPEIIGFVGGDARNYRDLNAELEVWLEDEKFIITKSCMIFVPAGMMHCPIYIKRVDRPIFHWSVVTGSTYSLQRK